jgi:hypothetical protein
MLLLASCGGSDPVAPPPSEGSATIGAAGGTLKGPDGVVLTLPDQSVASDTTFRIARDSAGAPPLVGMTLLSPIYAITPHGIALDRLGSLTLPYDASKQPAGSNLVVLRGEADGTWHVQPNLGTQAGVAVADVAGLSWWAVGVCTPGDAGVFGFGIGDCPANHTLRLGADGIDLNLVFQRPIEQPVDFTLSLRWDRPAGVDRVDDLLWHGPGLATGSAQFNGPTLGYWRTLPVHLDPSTIAGATVAHGVTVHYKALAQYCWTGFIIGRGPNQTVCWSYDVDLPVRVHDTGIPGAPVITTQPQSVTVTEGQPASFTVAATAAGTLTMDWGISLDAGASWASLGESSSTLSIPSAALDYSGALLRVHLCDTIGSSQTCIDSGTAQLTVIQATAPPAFTTQPASVSVVEGQTASISVAASGEPPPRILVYQGAAPGGALVQTCAPPGSGTSNTCTFTTGALGASQSGLVFQAVADNSAGSATSSAAVVTVTSSATGPAIATEPLDASTPVGSGAVFSVVAGGTAPLSYQWRFNGTPLTDHAAAASTSGIAGSGSASLAVTNAQAADAGSYSVVVTNGTSSATSRNAALTVTGTGACSGWCSVPPAGYYANQLAFGSAQTGIAVGSNLLRTTDGGASWQLLPTSFTGGGGLATFYDVAFVDASTVVIVGTDNTTGGGLIYRSTDAGTTWTLVASPAQVPTAIAFSGNTGLAITFNTLLRSTDGGATWSTLTPGYNFYSVTFAPPGVTALASVYNTANGANELRRSIDGGQTWTLVAPLTGMSQWLRRMSFSTSSLGIGVIGASNGAALVARTSDQGATWSIIDTGLPGYFNAVLLTPQNVALAVGTGGGIARSVDAGATWAPVASSNAATLRSVASPSTGIYSAVGDQVLLRNTSGGSGP